MTELVRRTIGDTIELQTHLAPDLWLTQVDAGEVRVAEVEAQSEALLQLAQDHDPGNRHRGQQHPIRGGEEDQQRHHDGGERHHPHDTEGEPAGRADGRVPRALASQ